MANKLCPHGLLKHLDQTYDVRGTAALRVLLIRSGNNVAASLATAQKLSDITSLNECRDGGYSVQTPTGVAWSVSGSAIRLASDAVEFANDGDQTGDSIVGALTAIYTGTTKADWIPFAWNEFSQSTSLVGTDLPVEWHNGLSLSFSATTTGTSRVYTAGPLALLNQTYDVTDAGRVITAMLMGTTNALAADHDHPNDITGELDDTGYTRQVLTNVQWEVQGSRVCLVADEPSWDSAGDGSAAVTKFLHILKVGTSPSNSADLLLRAQPLSTAFTPPGEARTIRFPASGLLRFSL